MTAHVHSTWRGMCLMERWAAACHNCRHSFPCSLIRTGTQGWGKAAMVCLNSTCRSTPYLSLIFPRSNVSMGRKCNTHWSDCAFAKTDPSWYLSLKLFSVRCRCAPLCLSEQTVFCLQGLTASLTKTELQLVKILFPLWVEADFLMVPVLVQETKLYFTY